MARGAARIVIAERWSILRRGLIGLVHGVHTVVDQVEDPADLRRVLTSGRVDVVIIGHGAGVELKSVVGGVRRDHAATCVMVLCDQIDPAGLRELLQAGAAAVLSKKLEDDNLLDSIDRVLRGERVIDQRFLPLLFGSEHRDGNDGAEPTLLTAREQEVLAQLARGSSNREIADALLVGEATVKSHLGRIYTKLGVDGRHRAVGRAVELGLLR